MMPTMTKNHTGVGRPRIELLPNFPYPMLTERMVPALEKYWMSDRKIDMVPKVTMKGAILNLATMIPFSAPQKEPRTSANRKVSTIPIVDVGPKRLRKKMEMPPTNAVMEPTERSMPPEMMISVIPKEMMPV